MEKKFKKGEILGEMTSSTVNTGPHKMTKELMETEKYFSDSVIKVMCSNCGFVMDWNQEKLDSIQKAFGFGAVKENSYLEVNGCLSCGKKATDCLLKQLE